MATFTQQKNGKIIVKDEVPTKLKKKIAVLLNQCMKDYKITSGTAYADSFKKIFKSNLYFLLDNEYHKRKEK